MTPAVPSRTAQPLPDIHDVEPLGDADLPCMVELRDVLARHGKLGRFGVALLHSHFTLSADEILLEETDVANRVQRIRPVAKEHASDSIETIWQLGEGGPKAMLGCRQYCGRDIQGNHSSFHSMT